MRQKTGLQIVRRTLSDGTSKTYIYPRLRYGTEDPDGIAYLSTAYRKSSAWQRLSKSTQATYDGYLEWLTDVLVTKDGKRVPLSMLDARGIRGLIYEAQDRMAVPHFRDIKDERNGIVRRSQRVGGPAAADMAIRVLSILLEWAVDREILEFNAARKIKPVSERKSRAEKFLTYEQQTELLAKADSDERAIIGMALCTGLRAGDLRSLTREHIKGGWLVIVPQKTQRLAIKVSLPIAAYSPLERLVEGLPRSGYLLTRKGEQWHRKTLQDRWARLRGGADIHFHDLRGTLATRLSEAGCTDQESNAVLGKVLVGGTLRDYVARTRHLSENAFRKLEAWEKQTGKNADLHR